MPRYRVTHTTTYAYEELVSICHNEAHLEPRDTRGQRCRRTRFQIEPEPSLLDSERDYFGNHASFFTVQSPHHRMVVTARSELDLSPRPQVDCLLTPGWESVRDRARSERSRSALSAFEMTFESPLVTRGEPYRSYAAPAFTAGRPVLEAALELTRRIHEDFEYRPGSTSVTTPLAEAFAARSGVCQDFAHVELACLRALGVPARYVSGYIRTISAGGESAAASADAPRTIPASETPALVGTDASHAWVSVWCGSDAGWVDLDPTNDMIPSDQHVTLAWGRDYSDVAPIKGVLLGGGGHTITVGVSVELLPEPVRPGA